MAVKRRLVLWGRTLNLVAAIGLLVASFVSAFRDEYPRACYELLLAMCMLQFERERGVPS